MYFRPRKLNLVELVDDSMEEVARPVTPMEDVAGPSTAVEDVAGPSTSTALCTREPATSSIDVEAEHYFLQQQIDEHRVELKRLRNKFSYQHIKDNNNLIFLYTGLPNAQIYEALCDLFKDIEITYYYNWSVVKINRQDQILLTLMKLRQNFPHEDLAGRFGISTATVSNIIITWINAMHKVCPNDGNSA